MAARQAGHHSFSRAAVLSATSAVSCSLQTPRTTAFDASACPTVELPNEPVWRNTAQNSAADGLAVVRALRRCPKRPDHFRDSRLYLAERNAPGGSSTSGDATRCR